MGTFKAFLSEANKSAEDLETRYHTVKTKHWERAQQQGHLNPRQYLGQKIWTSKHPTEHYQKAFPGHHGLDKDHVELAITLPKSSFKLPRGLTPDDTADRVTDHKVSLDHVKIHRK